MLAPQTELIHHSFLHDTTDLSRYVLSSSLEHKSGVIGRRIARSPFCSAFPRFLTPIAATLDLQDKRHARGRFGWVKRLVQGQNKNITHGVPEPHYRRRYEGDYRPAPPSDEHNRRKSLRSVESPGVDFLSDEESMSVNSDNVSTVPLKLIMSRTSTTNSPSILSGEGVQDGLSYVTSTAETSLAPSTHMLLLPSVYTSHFGARSERERDRDSELIVTLASSSRRTRRRSIDTNCSMAGIPPASIMERLTVQLMTEKDTNDNDRE